MEESMAQHVGGVYSDDKCPLCNGNFKDDHKSALRCDTHPQHTAGTFKVKFRGTTARFSSYTDAKLFLDSKRLDIARGNWRKKEKTLGEIVDSFIDWKQDLAKVGQVGFSTVATYRSRLNRVLAFMGTEMRVSEVEYKHIHDFLYKSSYRPKTIHDSYVLFKEMVRFAHSMGYWPSPPSLTDYRVDVEKTMTLRNTITKEEQGRVLDAVYHCEWWSQPRLYIGIKFLCTYINVRPGELLGCNEEDLDRKEGILVIRKHKTGNFPKYVRLLQEDVNLFNTLPTGVPGMPLFRHDRPVQRVRVGDRFGTAAFSRAWKRGCKVAGVEDVDLYGGTRHSSAISLYRDSGLSPEQVRKATGHRSSSSFERYFNMDLDDIKELHREAAPTSPPGPITRWEINII
jgi:integrase